MDTYIPKPDSLAIVIVTYNRIKDLTICLEALSMQTLKPNEIIIINNKSTDNTHQTLTDSGYVATASCQHNELGDIYQTKHPDRRCPDTMVTYILKSENDGGAGGFYAGMKTGFEHGHEWILLMDDDGRADKDELSEMLRVSKANGLKYANALVINRDNPDELAFDLFSTPNNTDFYTGKGIIPGCGSPFNGTLIHRSLISEIGFVKKEMFVWGDDAEYTARAKAAGHPIATICSALHYHPKTGKSINIVPFINKWKMLPPNTNRSHIFYRNHCYIFHKYGNNKMLIKFIMKNILGTVLNLQFKYLPSMIKAFRHGFNGNFSTTHR